MDSKYIDISDVQKNHFHWLDLMTENTNLEKRKFWPDYHQNIDACLEMLKAGWIRWLELSDMIERYH